jgi:hypothetical protein
LSCAGCTSVQDASAGVIVGPADEDGFVSAPRGKALGDSGFRCCKTL